MKNESPVQKEIFAEIGSLPDTRLFRNTVGLAYHGEKIAGLKLPGLPYIKIPFGFTLLKNSRPVKIGLFKGSSDLVGYTRRKITPEMVGKTVALFTSLEVKRADGGRRKKEQKNWIGRVLEWGGLAGFVTSAAEAKQVIDQPI